MFPDDATAERCQLDKGETGGFAFTGRLREAGIRISMDGRGRCLDNIFIERLWRSLKYAAVYLRELADGFEARRVIGEWIYFYNTERPHSALGGNAGRGLPRRPACGYDGQAATRLAHIPTGATTNGGGRARVHPSRLRSVNASPVEAIATRSRAEAKSRA